jgi:hypothetical protein
MTAPHRPRVTFQPAREGQISSGLDMRDSGERNGDRPRALILVWWATTACDAATRRGGRALLTE